MGSAALSTECMGAAAVGDGEGRCLPTRNLSRHCVPDRRGRRPEFASECLDEARIGREARSKRDGEQRCLLVAHQQGDLKRSLAECARKNLYVTGSGMWSETYLQCCMEISGPERLLFSTDFPYQYRPGGKPRRFLEAVKLDDAARDGFAHGNWERLSGDARSRRDRI